jgi:peptide deformylase
MIKDLKLVHWSHPVLRMKCNKIAKFDLVNDIVERMFEIVEEENGAGLAAPQIGIPWQLFVVNLNKPLVFVNPCVKIDNRKVLTWKEGCLSLPGVILDIQRSRDVCVEALDINGKPFKAKYAGLHSCCVQHEFDHLNGKLIADPGVGILSEEESETLKKWENHDDLEPPSDAIHHH